MKRARHNPLAVQSLPPNDPAPLAPPSTVPPGKPATIQVVIPAIKLTLDDYTYETAPIPILPMSPIPPIATAPRTLHSAFCILHLERGVGVRAHPQ
jgi:hypothetical protein